MRIGQRTAIHFLSQVATAVVGTLATIYFARELGSAALGAYFLALALVSWASFPVLSGFPTAITKRISEGTDQGAYAITGVAAVVIVAPLFVVGLFVFRGPIGDYVGVSAIALLVAMFLAEVFVPVVTALLNGRNLPHISGLLLTLGTVSRSVLQVGAVLAGLGVIGLFGGYALGWGIAILVGTVLVVRLDWSPVRPGRRHLRQLIGYAKYSWLGGLRGKVVNWVDILVLGLFVAPELVGIYGVAWNVTRFLMMFGDSISSALFPEISRASESGAEVDTDSDLITQSLRYTGLFLIPGLLGGVLLGAPLLRIYGPSFAKGDVVLAVLLGGAVLHGYQSQLLNGLNAVDRPALAFRSNGVLIAANVVLNVLLVATYGWIGAAVATALASALALAFTYRYLRRTVSFSVPIREIGRQSLAAGVMALVVLGGRRWLLPLYPDYEFALALSLVGLGAGVYFTVLLYLSANFRRTVRENLGVELERFLVD